MRLRELLPVPATAVGRLGDVEVAGLAVDSRRVRPGDVFFALAGVREDGRRHVREALARGAVAVVAEEAVDAAPTVVVGAGTARALLGVAAARLAGDPTAALTVVGVTGTNGKTTTTYLLEEIWRAAGACPGVVGTVAYRFAGVSEPAPLTTPDAPTLQGLFARMRARGTTHVAVEVSSHALEQDRVAGTRFDAAVFTNLTRDHLDYHGDIDRYWAAKARLFLEHLPAGGKRDPVAVVNADDPAGARLLGALRARAVPFGRGPRAAVRAYGVATDLGGTRGEIDLEGTRIPLRTRLVGAPHVENALAAAATAWALGVSPDAIAAGLAAAVPPPGRLEQLHGPGFTVLVDYAHSPDALARALEALRPLTAGRLVAVFGCGGDRDRGKRPLMGMAAARLADVVVLTSDNPRTEDAARIIADIEVGVCDAGMPALAVAEPGAAALDGGRGYVVRPERAEAIALAVALARPGDVVLVAGKGHEDYQIVGAERRPFDDREVVRRVLAARAAHASAAEADA
jgi:UDP-N-acetylmuramoyl-L-alanyl-D-glutamate--2,6-diaminopimelate ligase